MKKIKNQKQLINLISKLAKQFEINNIYINNNCPHRYIMEVSIDKMGKQILSYNLKRTRQCSYNYLIRAILHEFGHIKYKTAYLASRIQSELIAERYMLKQTKKYYPNIYLESIKEVKINLKDKEWIKKFPIHYGAFAKIKEYKEE